MEGAKMMKKWLLLAVFLLSFLFPPATYAKETLQQLIDETPANGTLLLKNKTYVGDIVIEKPITIKGAAHTVIKGSGNGNVISIRAPHVTIANVTVTNSGKSRSTQEEYAAIKVYSDNNTLKHITITNSFHGIYLSQAHHNVVEYVRVIGKSGEIAGQGNGLHVYYSNFNKLAHNTIVGTRDGMFFDYANHNVVKDNDVSRTRYGLHYMYSDDNEFYRNRFTLNTGGAAIMNSNRIVLKGNEFLLNKGMRSFGVLLQMANDNKIIGNEFYQNERAFYIDQSTNNFMEGNTIVKNQIGVELWGSSQRQTFTNNRFWNNTISVLSLGGEENNRFSFRGVGNHWGDDAHFFDLNQDGKGDSPFQYKSSLHKIVEQNELAYLFLNTPSIKLYEKINELMHETEVMATDNHPFVDRHSMPWTTILVALVMMVWILQSKRGQRQ